MKLNIFSLNGIEYAGDAESLTVKTAAGEITVLDHHRPLITLLSSGTAIVRGGGREQTLPVAGGFMEVTPENVVNALID